MSNAAITVDLNARIANFETELKKATGTLDSFGKKGDQIAAGLKGAFADMAAGLAVGALATFAKSGIDAADALNDMSLRLKVSVKDLASFKLAAEQSGTSLEGVGKGIARLTRSMGDAEGGNKQLAAALSTLGVTARDPKEAFYQLADAVQRIQDPAQRAALLNQVLGKSYQELIPLLEGGGQALRDSAKASETFSDAMAKLAPDADKFNDQLALLKTNAAGAAATILAKLVPSLNEWIAVGQEVVKTGSLLDKVRFFALGNASDEMVGRVRKMAEEAETASKKARTAVARIETVNDKPAKRKTSSAKSDPLASLLSSTDIGKLADFEKNVGLLNARFDNGRKNTELYTQAMTKLIETAFSTNFTEFDKQLKDSNAASKEYAAVQAEFDRAGAIVAEAAARDAAAIAAQVVTQREHNEEIGLSAAALNELEQSRFDASIAALQQFEAERMIAGASNEELAAIWDKIDALKELKQLRGEGAEKQGSFDALKDLNDYLDPAKAKSFGDALSNSFGKAGTAIGKMAGAFDNYAQRQAEFNKKRAALSPEDLIKKETELTRKQASIQIDAYADMAGAAKGFFEEGTSGYKAMHAVEQAFRAYQMAASIAAIVQGKTETTASVAQSGTKAVASTAAGVAKAFEQMGVWGFVGAAAIIAFMASMGIRSGGGSGSVSMSAMRQSEQGTGTVLGDPDAKSESLINALDMLADVNTLTMQYSARMAKSLQNIEIALTGVSSMIYRTPGLTSGNLSGIQEMSKTGTLGFSSKSVAVTDSGLTYQGLISGIAEGLQSFTEVTTNKSSWFGLKKSTRTDTVLTDADDDVSQQFQMIFNNISDSLIAAGGVLGNSADILETQIANIEIDLGMVSLKGLKGDELEEALNAVISASADNIARQALPGLEKYQQVGEGYFETAIRVAYSTEVVQASLAALDKGFTGAATDIVDFSQSLINAFGDLETMGDALAGYYDLFYSEEEKLAHTTASLVAGFARINLEVPETSAEFRALVDALDLTTAAGQDAFVAMMDMAPAFAEVAEAAIDTAEALNDAALDAADAAMSALSRAVGAERDTIIAAYEQQSAAIQASINSVSSSVANLTALSSALASTLIGMRPQEYAAQYRAQAQAQIGAALAIARAGGPLPTAESLKGALSTLTQDSRGQFATRTDYMRDQLRTAAELRELSDLADDALSIDERQLRAMQDQLDQLKLGYESEMLRLDSILDSAQAQIDALHGIDTSVLSVEAAIVALGAAINAAKAPAAVAAASGTASAGGSATHALTSTIAAYGAANGGDAYYFIEGVNDLSAKMETKAMIAATLGITVEEAWAKFDSKGLAYWEEVQRQWDAGLKPTTSSIPGFAVGTNYVPSDMVAQIHAGERIIPAADNTELMARLRDPQANNAALVAELKALREEVVLLRAETRATVSNTGKTAALLDRAMPDGDAMATRAAA